MIRHTLRATVRGVGIVLMTVVDVTALSVWYGLVGDAPPASLAAVVGVAALTAGLLVQGLLAHVTVRGWRREVPALSVAALALAETVLWVGWFAVVRQVGDLRSVALVGLALAVALVPRHTVADNVLRGRNALSSLASRVPVGLAAVEAAGATAWLLLISGVVVVPEWFVPISVFGFSTPALVGAAVLAGALAVQHAFAVRYALRASHDVGGVEWQSSWGTPPE